MQYHTLTQAEYEELRYNALLSIEESGLPKLSPYVDSVGIATIGIGFNLRSASVLDVVLEELGFNVATPSPAELSYINEIISISNTNYPSTAAGNAQLQADLDDVMLRRGGSRTTFTFSNNQEIRNVFDQLMTDIYEPIVSNWRSGIVDSSERVALVSLAYNNPSLLGSGLSAAFANDNRAEAWYEIRYNSNGGASRSGGIAKRRYYESHLFGLYESGVNDPASMTEADSREIYEMYTNHRSEILAYENLFSSYISNANNDYPTGSDPVETLEDSLLLAANYLLQTYMPSERPISIDVLDIQIGGSANDTINGSHRNGYDESTGDEKNDLILAGEGNDNVNAGGGDDVVYGQDGDDVLHGNEGEDFIHGGIGSDLLYGETENDILDARDGAVTDTLYGGAGDDIYYIDTIGGSSDTIIEDPSSGTDTVRVDNSYTLTDNVENLELLSTATSTSIELTGNNLDNIIRGNDGVNTLRGEGGNDTLIGGAGSDRMEGGAGYDIYEVEGNDSIFDSDGQGQIRYQGRVLNGGVGEPEGDPRIFTGDDGTVYNLQNDYLLTIRTTDGTTVRVNSATAHPIPPSSGDGPRDVAIQFDLGVLLTRPRDPLVLDLNGDGVQLLQLDQSPAFFDLENTGLAHNVGWADSNDGLLALDLNQDGEINNITELFGSTSIDGFTMLSEHDLNNDNIIDQNDAVFADLKIWRDANSDGVTQAGELLGISDYQIKSISLNDRPVVYTTPIPGTFLTDTSVYVREDGSTGEIANAVFERDSFISRSVLDIPISDEALLLPNLVGYGNAHNLQMAATLDSLLLNDIKSLIDVAGTDYNELSSNILIRWAGAQDVEPDSRGPFFNAQYLSALETFRGENYETALGTNPTQFSSQILNQAWQSLVDYYAVRIAISINDYSEYLPYIEFNPETDDIILNENIFNIGNRIATIHQNENEISSDELVMLSRIINNALDGGDIAVLTADNPDILGTTADEAFVVGGFEDNSINLSATNVEVRAGDGDNRITAFRDGAKFIEAGHGDDVISLGSGSSSVFAGDGNNSISVANGNHLIITGDDNDNIYVGDGDSFVDAGEGNNHINIGSGNATIQTGSGSNNISVDHGNYTITTQNGNDNINVGNGSSTINAGEGINNISTGEGDYQITAGSGNDYVYVEGGEAIINLAGGNNTVGTGIGTFQITTGSGADNVSVLGGVATINTGDGIDNIDISGGTATISSGNGNDYISAYGGEIVVDAGAGNDYVYASGSSDTLDGGTGNDYLEGGAGNDIYIFGRGYGNDTIIENDLTSGNIDTIQLRDDLTPADVILWRDDQNMYLKVIGTDDQLIIENWYYGNQYRIEQIVFNDGTVWAEAEFSQAIFLGTVTDDYLSGTDGDDTFEGLSGNDYFNGFGGNDTYYFGRGSGQDTIEETAGTDRIVMASDILVSDVILSRDDSSLILYLVDTDDSIRVESWFMGSNYRVESVEFEDGTIWDQSYLVNASYIGTDINDSFYGGPGSQTLVGMGGNDYLYGEGGSDILDGGSGNDQIDGGTGNDEYRFSRGDGYDVITEEGGTDKIVFATDITPSDITIARDTSNLYLSIDAIDQTIRINGFFDGSYARIESFEFSDGTVWDVAYVSQTNNYRGTDSADYINANDNDNLIDGRAGNDTLYGNRGNDTYLFGRGSGRDLILDYDATVGNVDVIQMGSGLVQSDVVITRDNNNLVIFIEDTGDRLQINNWFNSSAYHIERIEFEDGSVIDEAEMQAAPLSTQYGSSLSETLTGTRSEDNIYGGGGNDIIYGGNAVDNLYGEAGADTIYGGQGNDVIYGDGGADHIYGNEGNDQLYGGVSGDTYYYGRGDGNDTINEEGGTDRIVLSAGISETDVQLGRQDSTLFIEIIDTQERITIPYWFDDNTMRVESVQFADGTIWNTAHLINAPFVGTSQNDYIYANELNNVLIGGAGDDTLEGDAGSDEYRFGRGDGNDDIYDYSTSPSDIDSIRFADDILPSDILLSRDESNLYLTILDTNERLTVNSWFDDTSYRIEQVIFADGTIWNETELLQAVFLGTNGNDYLSGTSEADIFDGLAGNDTIDGAEGNDIYLFGRGSGNDVITDYDISSGNLDTIQLYEDVLVTDVLLSRDASNLFLIIRDTGEQLTVTDWFTGTENRIEQIVFNDGTVWNESDLTQAVLLGTEGNDYLTGTDGVDIFNGLGGDDYLDGGQGNDIYRFGRGSGNNVITEYDATPGNTDVIQFSADILVSDIQLTRDQSNLFLTIEDTGERITVEGWFDTPNMRVEQVIFNDGTVWTESDLLRAVYYGTQQLDYLHGNETPDLIDGLQGDDDIYGGSGNDELVGGLGNDTIDGGVGDDSIFGNEGNDYLVGGDGADTMNGGSGDDIYVVDNAGDVINELLDEGTDLVQSKIDYNLTENVENLLLVGSMTINGTGNSLDNILTGNHVSNTFSGNAGNDIIQGMNGDDILNGNDGDDNLDGGIGADQMIGGSGDDTYFVDNAADIVTELNGEGQDHVNSAISYTLTDHVENLTLIGFGATSATGNALDNVINGNNASNLIDGGLGKDTMIGRSGNDTYIVNDINDNVIEQLNQGIDSINSSVTYTLSDNVENLTLTGNNAINGTGNELANTLIGNEANNILTGNDGNDVIYTGEGADTVYGGLGDDIIVGDTNATSNYEVLSGESGNDHITGAVGNTIMIGGLGNDTLISRGGGLSYLIGDDWGATSGGDDLLIGHEFTDTMWGFVGNDTLQGMAGVDTLYGGDGNDILDGGTGNDQMHGEQGDDTYYVDDVNDTVIELEGQGSDTIYSSINYTLGEAVENLTLTGVLALNGVGNELDNILIGNSGINILDGGLGDDTLNGNGGNDTLAGGAGNDTYIINEAGAIVNENLGEGIDTVNSAINYVLTSNVENLNLTGINAINGSGNDLVNIIIGNDGNNTLYGIGGDDTLYGGSGVDTIYGGDGNDNVYLEGGAINQWQYAYGDAGDDIIEGSDIGFDVLWGGDGNDLLTAGNAYAYIFGDAGNDLLYANATGNYLSGGLGNDTLNGGAGYDTLLGGSGDDIIIGNGGNDIIHGHAGADIMQGGTGDDTYTVENIGDVVTEQLNEGIDTVSSNIDYILTDNVENLTLGGSNNINGTGNRLDNQITGNASNNILNGNGGNDTLAGGAGNDTYIINEAGAIVNENMNEGTDTVNSAINYVLTSNVENLNLTGINAINGTGNDSANSITGNDGDNILYGMGGDDNLYGGDGNDTLYGGDGNDVITGGAANAGAFEYLYGDAGNDIITTGGKFAIAWGGIGNDTLTGGAGENYLLGEDGNDVLTGGDGTLLLAGGLGDDTLIGGSNNETIYGGAGDDDYIFNRGTGQDTINDYEVTANTDQIILASDIAANQLWFEQSGNNLQITVLGTDDRMIIQNWFLEDSYHIEEIYSADANQLLIDNQVAGLVSAMAAFGVTDPSQFVPTTDQQIELNALVATHWQTV